MPLFSYMLIGFGYLATPTLLAWSWFRWYRNPIRNVSGYFAFSSLLVSSASVLLALSAAVYALRIDGFAFYDPRLLRIYRSVLLTSTTALLLSFGGVWSFNSLRWLSPLTALGTLTFWFCAAASE